MLGWLVERWKGEVLAEPSDLVGLAHIAEKAGQIERAMTFAQQAVGSGVGDASAEAHMLLARLERSRHAFDEEETHLLAAVQCGVSPWLEQAHLRLAITYEHTFKRLDKAMEHAILCGLWRSMVAIGDVLID